MILSLVLLLQAEDLSALRGANYVASYASTSVKMWRDYAPEVVERELGFAERAGLNTVRVFLHVLPFEQDPDGFVKRVRDFVERCDRRRIRPLFVLFDSCFGDEPSLEKAESPTWINNPGFSRLGADHAAAMERYVKAVVAPYAKDRRVLGWDVMNEPMADFNHVTREERDVVWAFVRRMAAVVKGADPTHPVTVGEAVVEYLPKTADLVDFLSVHSYAATPDEFRADLALARRYGREAKKPVVVTECGNPGAGQTYEMALEVLAEEGLGFYVWELMIGKMQFREEAGIFYPDGTVRELGAVAALAGFRLKREGGVPLRKAPDRSAMEKFLKSPEAWEPFLKRAGEAPRTREGILPQLEPLVVLGRLKARPRPEAMEIFEHGLSIAHLFRLGKAETAVASYERLLDLVRAALEPK